MGAFFYLPPMEEKLSCPVCATAKHPDASECTFCSYPFEGTDKEQGRFRGEVIVFGTKVEKLQKQMIWAQVILGLLCIFGLIVAYSISMELGEFEALVFAITALPSMIFGVCAVLLKKNPLLYSRIAFFFYLGFNILDGILEPATIINGILWKAVIITVLVGIMSTASDVMKKAKQAPYFYHKIFPKAKKRTILDEIND